jgi:valyl-tRNA synthetase
MNTTEAEPGDAEFATADRWIRSRLNKTVQAVHSNFATYRLDLVAQALYEFTWHEFCDWYLELSKPILQSEESTAAQKRGTRRTLLEVLETILRLLHPLMPFITEEIWQQVATRAGIVGETIMLQPYPQLQPETDDATAETELEWVRQFILGIRQIRGEMDIAPGRKLPVLLEHSSEEDRRFAQRNALTIERVGRVESITALDPDDTVPPSATALLGNMRIQVPTAKLIDVAAVRGRLGKQRERVAADLSRSLAKLENDSFVNNAPSDVVTQERQRVAEFEHQIAQLDEQLARLAALQ